MYLSSQERIAGANKSTTGLRSNARMYLSSQERIAGANKSTADFTDTIRSSQGPDNVNTPSAKAGSIGPLAD